MLGLRRRTLRVGAENWQAPMIPMAMNKEVGVEVTLAVVDPCRQDSAPLNWSHVSRLMRPYWSAMSSSATRCASKLETLGGCFPLPG